MKKSIEISVREVKIKYLTKPGIFAKHGLDNGTKLLLDIVEVKDNTLTADLGGGAGIISLVVAQFNKHGHIHLLDDHLRSIELAKENIELNKISNIEVYLSDLFSAVKDRSYHQILSNPPQQLGNDFLLELIEESYKHLKPHGTLWVVIKNNIKPVMERFLWKVFSNSIAVKSGREHTVLKAVRTN